MRNNAARERAQSPLSLSQKHSCTHKHTACLGFYVGWPAPMSATSTGVDAHAGGVRRRSPLTDRDGTKLNRGAAPGVRTLLLLLKYRPLAMSTDNRSHPS